MAQLSCKNLSIGYDSKIIQKDLDFSIEKGDYLCIVGENGAGKSTLMKTLLGLKTPLAGHISMEDGVKGNEIGYLPQQNLIQRDFPASVKEIVLSGCQGRCGFPGFYGAEAKKKAKEAMDKLGITHLKKSCYRELSGGQQQRVLLARALCATQKMLLLDEPVSGLDPQATQDLYDIIKKLNDEENITIIMISHDVGAALKYASHILHIGKTLFFGTKNEYLRSSVGKAFTTLKGGEDF